MKVVAAALLAVVCSWMLVGSAAGQAAGVRVVVNGVDVPLAAPAVLVNGQVMAPMSGLFESMGAIAAFYETDRTIVITNRVRTTVQLQLDQPTATVNGQPRALPAPPTLIGSDVFIPVQAVFAFLGAWVSYEDAERTVFVSSQVTSITPQVSGGVLQVAVDATGPVQVETNVLRKPDRLVVDFLNAVLRTQEREYAVNDAGVLRIRTAQFQVKPYVSRMVFDLDQPVEIRIGTAPTNYQLTLEVRPKDSEALGLTQGGVVHGSPFAPSPGPLKVLGVSFQPDGEAGRITIEGTGPMEYKIREFVFPDRLAIDIQDAVFVPVKQEIPIAGTAIVAIRAAQFTAHPPAMRVVVALKRRLNYVVSQSAGSLIVELNTDTARGHVVALDPGHGGRDPGAIGPTGLREADVVLDIALRVRDLLVRDGVRVLMIRDGDVTVELDERTQLARENGATIFVSIHTNASPRAAVNGTETYYLTPESLALAQMIQDDLGVALGIPSRGIKTANFVVLRDNDIPSVLVEAGFISHTDDESRLRDETFRQRIAEAVHHGIIRFLAVYPVPTQAP